MLKLKAKNYSTILSNELKRLNYASILGPKSEMNWKSAIQVPIVNKTAENQSKIVSISYQLKLSFKIIGVWTTVVIPITIGTVRIANESNIDFTIDEISDNIESSCIYFLMPDENYFNPSNMIYDTPPSYNSIFK